MNKNSFLKTATLVTLFSVAERALGFLYRIILSRTLGSEGVGIYQLALSVFAVFITATSSGIPITVSRLLAKYRAKKNLRAGQQTVSAALVITLSFSVPLFLLLYLGHGCLEFLFSDSRCAPVFLIMLYSFVFNSVYAVLRGSFWGNKQFLAYSVIEFIEEVVMIAVGSLLVVGMTDVVDGAKRAAFAVVASYLTSFSIAMIYFFCKGGKFVNPRGQFRPLLSSAMPITAMRTSASLVNSLISILLPSRLMLYGLTAAQAMSEYGVALGMAIPVLYTPSTVIGSIALVLTPEISDCFYREQHRRLQSALEKALKVTVFISASMIPLFFVFGADMGMLLYSSARSGEIIRNASVMLLPMSLNMLSSSMLNSLGCEKKTLLYYFFGAMIMLLSVWFLPRYIGIYALIVGQFLNHLLCAFLNLRLLHKKCVYPPAYRKFTLCMIAVAVGEGIFGSILYPLLTQIMGVFPAMLLAGFAMVLSEGVMLLPTGVCRTLFPFKRKKKILTGTQSV
jgi:stage V sporulation protein B